MSDPSVAGSTLLVAVEPTSITGVDGAVLEPGPRGGSEAPEPVGTVAKVLPVGSAMTAASGVSIAGDSGSCGGAAWAGSSLVATETADPGVIDVGDGVAGSGLGGGSGVEAPDPARTAVKLRPQAAAATA